MSVRKKQIQILLLQKLICRKGFDGTSIRNIAARRPKLISPWFLTILVQKNVYWNQYFIELKI
jgi:hypothetical protein